MRTLWWLRRVHGWIGLWGAVLGLLFGVTGVLLNHRAVMKLPAAQTNERNLQLKLPVPAPSSAEAMAAWVSTELGFQDRASRIDTHGTRRIGVSASRIRDEPARPVPWGDRTLQQPARWSAIIATPAVSYQVEYWAGNNYVNVRAGENNLFATLNNLHKGTGLGVAWVLLADTIGGAMVLLSLTGVLLWTQLHRIERKQADRRAVQALDVRRRQRARDGVERERTAIGEQQCTVRVRQRLIRFVRGEQDRHAARAQPIELAQDPHTVAEVEARRRLVEHQ